MLHYSERFPHEGQVGIEFFGFLGRQGTQLLADLQEMIAIPFESLQGGSRCEISRPVGMWIGSVWEEVIALGWPGDTGIVQGFQIARWSGV